MAKQYTNQVTVRVWRNVKRYGTLPTSHFGHAAVVLRGAFVPRDHLQISFWPRDGAGLGRTALRKQPGAFTERAFDDKWSEMNRLTALRLEVGYRQREGIDVPPEWVEALRDLGRAPLAQARPGQTRLDDVDDDGFPMWSQSPETKFALPGLGSRPRHWGLSITQVKKWWEAFSASHPTYQALSFQNCAGVALMALRAGGADAFVPLPHVHIYAEPVQVEHYAQRLQVELDHLEARSAALDQDIRAALASGALRPAMLAGDQRDGLWTVEEWKRRSALGPLQPRSAGIRAIDEALATYHALDWRRAYTSKYYALVQVFRGVTAHRQQKADSARSTAVLTMGLHVLALLRAPGPHYG
jgi:hypothetical protein